MAGPERIQWRQAFPSRPLSQLAWYSVSATLAVALVALFFGDEPELLADGSHNVLSALPKWSVVIALLGSVWLVHNVFRRPKVAASHYALTVRPGTRRTLVLPWANVEHIAVVEIGGEPILLIRCRSAVTALGNQPHWCDRSVMRDLAKSGDPLLARFDLAVRMNDFVGDPAGRVAAIAAFAPDHVVIATHASAT